MWHIPHVLPRLGAGGASARFFARNCLSSSPVLCAEPKVHAMPHPMVGAWSLVECAEILQDGSTRRRLGEGALGR